MLSFSSRQYARGAPRVTERLVGACILILLALIVSTFLVTSGLLGESVRVMPVSRYAKMLVGISDRPLFITSINSLSASRASQVADAMLPAMPVPWQRVRVIAISVRAGEEPTPAGLDSGDALGGVSFDELRVDDEQWKADLAAFDAQWVYRGIYYFEARTAALVQVVDVGKPESALGLWHVRKPANARPMAIGMGGWAADGRRTYGFWRGRYYTEIVVGPQLDEANVTQLARAVAGVQLHYGGPFWAQSVLPAGVARFADVGDESLLAPTKIERYTDNLYEKINGREGQFRAYHVVELRFGQYQNALTKQVFDVYIYDMGTAANAFGVYMLERSGASDELALGRDGYMSGTNVYFVKSKYYVNVLGPAGGEESALAASKRIARAIADTIPGRDKPFWVEFLLPADDRVPHGLSYRATSALGYDFLENMFFAAYKSGAVSYQLCLLKAGSPARAEELFDQYAEATAKYDTILGREPSDGGATLISEAMGIHAVMFHKGVFVGGLIECENRGLANERAIHFRDRLPVTNSTLNVKIKEPATDG